MKKIGILMLSAVLALAVFTGCTKPAETQVPEQTPATPEVTQPKGNLPTATITLADGGVIVMELYPEIAPNSVNNFIYLADSGIYDGVIFHRVIKDFMIQGGDPLGTGQGGPDYAIAGEFSANGFENSLSHTPGVVSMARTQDMDSAGSQFFIVHGDATFLDGEYAAFAKVIEGMDVVDAVANVKTFKGDKPATEVVMTSVKINLNGYEAAAPIKITK